MSERSPTDPTPPPALVIDVAKAIADGKAISDAVEAALDRLEERTGGNLIRHEYTIAGGPPETPSRGYRIVAEIASPPSARDVYFGGKLEQPAFLRIVGGKTLRIEPGMVIRQTPDGILIVEAKWVSQRPEGDTPSTEIEGEVKPAEEE